MLQGGDASGRQGSLLACGPGPGSTRGHRLSPGPARGDHAATPSDIIESAKITRGVIQNFLLDSPQITNDPRIKKRKEELVEEAKYLLEAIKNLSNNKDKDPLTDPVTLAKAIKIGILDAPHLCGNPHAAGKVLTVIKEGACVALDPQTGQSLSEKIRIPQILRASVSDNS